MRKALRDVKADPTAIGNVVKAPFARLPDPETLFSRRAARFRRLSPGNPLGPYLDFLAGLGDVQTRVQDGLAEPALPDGDMLARAEKHAMPPLDRNGFRADESFDALFSRLVAETESLGMPDEARAALGRTRDAEPAAREAMIANVLTDAIPVEAVAEHTIVASVLQVHFARLAARLDVATLKPVGDGVCPVCGGAPVSSMVVGWQGSDGARFCCCSLCGTLWNYVRARCTLCGSTKDISFQEVEGTPGTIKAECCGSCRGYLKVFYQQKDVGLDPVADDVATLGLDLLVRELDFRRGGVNPFLTGY